MNDLSCESIRSEIGGLCTVFRNVLLDMGFEESSLSFAELDGCKLATVTDQLAGEERITGRWLDDQGLQIAHFIRYANGSLFAEHEVAQPHPQRPEMFVELLEVWGQPGSLKHDLRLLPSL